MLNDILPETLKKAINMLNYKSLCEVRLRAEKPITVNYLNSYYYLGEGGIVGEKSNALICSLSTIENVIHKASNYSVYAVNDQIKNGFISCEGGIRIGIAGEVVFEEDKMLTIKNISSLNIRLPHEVSGCSLPVLNYLFENEQFLNTLIIGSPATGKTTFLRDLCLQISKKRKDYNLLLLDERFEIASCSNGIAGLNVGNFTDIISGGEKNINIINGIRSMAPDILLVDELGKVEDFKALEYASQCGIKIIATIHSKNIKEVYRKKEFENLLKNEVFKRFVTLNNLNGKGTIESILKSDLKPVQGLI